MGKELRYLETEPKQSFWSRKEILEFWSELEWRE
jgi:hypothetical protein